MKNIIPRPIRTAAASIRKICARCPTSYIGPDVIIRGNVSSLGTVAIEGTVLGNVAGRKVDLVGQGSVSGLIKHSS